ncbi:MULTISPECIES: type II secretion system F family protein [unclassified Streptomyces]|uniref:type II secretion system F family protein n=1 Tax=unclassified Streptomyces TaxID=2593676 RepID=UPI00224F84A7|nr:MULTISPECIES: type II secretion system F family protein [unclassified Streptomyces]MCX5049973.1 type II secretion system F family protein [Streptomyces sp. NBC_00474]MCX5060373.1 type II secretion system F family protein [Streptomyces sp. NBC_00452]MCX5247888.1 type II secretion system F family protein [Streptomyces sp. NBC_00201]MCX5286337.1 type II secretion system F family protein [Streptomyces sp. NBC_00183]
MSAEVFHRLGVTVGALLVLGWLLLRLETVRRERRVIKRLAGLVAGVEVTRARPRLEVRDAARRWLPAVGVVCAGWVLVGNLAGALVGLVVAGGLWRWRARQAAAGGAEINDASEAARQLPLSADLVAACIAAGAGTVVAARAVGEALGGPVGDALARGAAEVRLGGEPAEAWQRLAALPGAGPLARLLERADVSGLPAATPVARLAADVRADWARAATTRARRAAVMVTAPVGLCFLPAFIAIGVLPVVIGLAGGVLGGGGG